MSYKWIKEEEQAQEAQKSIRLQSECKGLNEEFSQCNVE